MHFFDTNINMLQGHKHKNKASNKAAVVKIVKLLLNLKVWQCFFCFFFRMTQILLHRAPGVDRMPQVGKANYSPHFTLTVVVPQSYVDIT